MNPADLIARIDHLELLARQIVEGTLAGRHKSPRTGFAVEFAQHREYTPGDDTRHLDWKVFARTGRYHLKQYEQETNLVAWLIVDTSESMRVGTKFTAASALAAALAYLVVQQGDSVGLATLAGRGEIRLRASANTGQFREEVRALAGGPTRGPASTATALTELGGLLGRRAVLFLIGDFLDPAASYDPGLRLLRSHRHDVTIFQILDATEMTFPFQDPTLFEGVENLPDVHTDPLAIRENYLRELQNHLTEFDSLCRGHAVDCIRMSTEQDLGRELAGYLFQRQAR